MSKKTLNEYQKLMDQKFNLEDNMKIIFQEQRKLKNKVIELGLERGDKQRQLSLVEDQIRVFFERKILKFEEEKE